MAKIPPAKSLMMDGKQEVHGVGMAIGWGATRPLLPGPAAPVEEKEDPLDQRRMGLYIERD